MLSSQVIVCTPIGTKSMTCFCRFEDILRSLTVERKDICDAMIFALDNADSAFEVHSAFSCKISLRHAVVPADNIHFYASTGCSLCNENACIGSSVLKMVQR